ncbi:Mss4-like protein [Clohesyomyces aquaticus]|uniref:Mss4-like protein n=1 Tax=Clohesyomyces aquaticus TaxID=1231657 RepID=A0A1Y1YTH8_9PLEO|nr:Mss4-like protein [Clohesyomyces aquaticus]
MSENPFPAVGGRCVCGQVSYRMETAPLFCHACHCSDCQRRTGSAFAAFCVIEADRVTLTSKTAPITVIAPEPPMDKKSAACPRCYTKLWDKSDEMGGVISIKTGTLDMPGLMEPDLHIFIEAKVAWLQLPKDARTCKGYYDRNKEWPKSSLSRLEACMAKHKSEQDDANGQADRTPRAESPTETDEDEDEDTGKDLDEMERTLRERLERLTLKLNDQEKA